MLFSVWNLSTGMRLCFPLIYLSDLDTMLGIEDS